MSWSLAILLIVVTVSVTAFLLSLLDAARKRQAEKQMLAYKRLEIEHDKTRPVRGLFGEVRDES